MNLQHRGQDGGGILTVDSKRPHGFQLVKGSGLVDNVFSERAFKNLRGEAAIGHCRYATIGRNDPNLLQPFLDYHAGLGLAHNGNIVNFYQLREKLFMDKESKMPWLESDSELILRLLSRGLNNRTLSAENIFDALGTVMNTLVGSYSCVCLTEHGDIFGFRDPNGIRPLVLGSKIGEDGETIHAIASETVVLSFLEYTNLSEIEPGEAVFVDSKGNVTRKVIRRDSYSPCMFEWVYFARVESEFGDNSVYNARFNLGLLLAKEIRKQGIEADVVIPVPETSRIAATALAEALNLPCRELLIKNRYVQRTFILDDQQSRQEAIRRKLYPIAAELKGKRCLIVDDSIVRGNTAKQIVRLVRQSGASEVTLVSSCPPIANPCYYGIDFPSSGELIASNRTNDEIAQSLGVDRVVFQTMEGLKEALGQKSLCTGCLTGKYPTDVESGKQFEMQRTRDREAPLKKSSC